MESNIVEKIKKLLSLGGSSNENESKLAMKKAQSLLAKYKLDMSDIDKKESTNIKYEFTNISSTRSTWRLMVADLIADNFACYTVLNRNGRKTLIAFLGEKDDVEICKITFEYALDCVKSNLRKLQYKHWKEFHNNNNKGMTTDYTMGFYSGLKQMFDLQKEQNQEWGLVLQKSENVTNEYDKLTSTKSTKAISYRQNKIYDMGIKHGKEFSINDKVTS